MCTCTYVFSSFHTHVYSESKKSHERAKNASHAYKHHGKCMHVATAWAWAVLIPQAYACQNFENLHSGIWRILSSSGQHAHCHMSSKLNMHAWILVVMRVRTRMNGHVVSLIMACTNIYVYIYTWEAPNGANSSKKCLPKIRWNFQGLVEDSISSWATLYHMYVLECM